MHSVPPLLFLVTAALTACADQRPEPAPATSLNIGDVLQGGNPAGFRQATEPREFHFPVDHTSHPDFRSEWWYLTGNLADEQGRHYGYQVTFFRNALAPADNTATNPSAWATRQIWMAHAAVTDVNENRHYAAERFSRAEPGLAGTQLDPLRIWLNDWELRGSGNTFPWRLQLADAQFALELTLNTNKRAVLHGDHGLSRKGSAPGNASYYYSYTRVETQGTLRIANQSMRVAGLSWLDREWSTSALEKNQTGWDWFALQFDDGGELMYYRLRDETGGTHPNSQGTRVAPDGARRLITRQELELTEIEYWQSESGRRYPVHWRLHYRPTNTTWLVKAAVDDQLMDFSFRYWEGAVEVRHPQTGRLLGRGYLEMVYR